VWLIYALGGGWGHLTRAIALARVAQRDRRVLILTNSPYAEAAAGAAAVRALPPGATADRTRQEVIRAIGECRPECLIVDTFPRGIGGELAGILAGLAARKVLVARDLNPRYVAAARLREFVAAHYDLVLVPGAGEGLQMGDLPAAFTTAPWLVRSAHEIPDRNRVRTLLRLAPHEEQCVLVCASGKPDELDWYGAVVRELLAAAAPVRLIAAARPPQCPEECWVRYWPALDLFACASVVVGGAGYNTVAECLAWDVPLVARAWPRAYDRQELRARNAGGRVTLVREPPEAARVALDLMRDHRRREPRFVNGAMEAAVRIASG